MVGVPVSTSAVGSAWADLGGAEVVGLVLIVAALELELASTAEGQRPPYLAKRAPAAGPGRLEDRLADA